MRFAIAVLFFALLVISCGKQFEAYSNGGLAEVIFVNESSYNVNIYNTSFSGPLIVDKLMPGDIYSTMLSPSDNYGAGSVFPIRYWYLMDGENLQLGGTDPDAQITQNIEANQRYMLYIPEPTKLEGSEAFLKILNNSDMSIEFNRLTVHFKQINGATPVPSRQTGIYKIESSPSGVEFSGYTIWLVGGDKYCPIPAFTAKNGYIYEFEFNGTEVIRKGEQEI